MNIVLTGFMAAGKTTVGKILAKKLDMQFVDTDVMTEEKYGMKISDIFERFGEAEFRRMEAQTIETAAKLENAVIATGGGAVLNTKNIEVLKKNGIIVNLEPNRQVIEERLSGGDGSRPLSGGGIDKLMARFDERRRYYDLCDFKVYVTHKKDSAAVAEEITEILHKEWL
ncbi:MAG: shikimate kinase [Clostridiales bacterium]|nr:shikimate kinase [Clostridiales bacterium]